MSLVIRNVTVDSADAPALARFWAEALGWHVFTDDDPEVLVAVAFPPPPGAQTMLFIPVPEGKTAKNRLHLDLAPSDRTRDEELPRLLELGARLVEDHRKPDGTGWVYLADPEGNEFCLERGDDERGASAVQRWRLTPAP